MTWGSQVQYPKLNQGLLLNSKVGAAHVEGGS